MFRKLFFKKKPYVHDSITIKLIKYNILIKGKAIEIYFYLFLISR